MNDEDTVSLNAAQLAKHALHQAYESPTEYHYGEIPDDLDVSLYDAHKHLTDVTETTTDSRHGLSFADETDETLDGLRVHAELTGYESERVARRTRHHPAEYKQHEVTVHVTGWWFPRDQLAPLTAIEVGSEGGIPEPDPDVHAHMYDEL